MSTRGGDNNPKDRRALLQQTWLLMANAVLKSLQADQPSAATLDTARRWLDSNGVTLEALQAWRGGLGFDGPLPVFNDDDDDMNSGSSSGSSDGAATDPLRRVVPFAAAEE